MFETTLQIHMALLHYKAPHADCQDFCLHRGKYNRRNIHNQLYMHRPVVQFKLNWQLLQICPYVCTMYHDSICHSNVIHVNKFL